jgi:hypothetical protein
VTERQSRLIYLFPLKELKRKGQIFDVDSSTGLGNAPGRIRTEERPFANPLLQEGGSATMAAYYMQEAGIRSVVLEPPTSVRSAHNSCL